MTAVIFVRHAMPEVRPGVAARLWGLSDTAREDCVLLAHGLGLPPAGPAIVTSPERKARETADVLGLRLGRLVLEDAAFAEADRPAEFDTDYRTRATAYLSGRDYPGWEPLAAVVRRFAEGVARAAAAADDGPAIVVTHGLALAAYVASVTGIDVGAFWESLTLPDAWLVDPDTGTIERRSAPGLPQPDY